MVSRIIIFMYLLGLFIQVQATGADTLWTRKANPQLLSCNSVAFGKNGTKLLSVTDCHPAYTRLFDISTGMMEWEYTNDSLMCFMDLKFSPNGKYFAIMEEFGKLLIFDYEGTQPAVISQINTKSGASLCLAFSPDNSKVITTGFDDSIRVFSLSTQQQVLAFGRHTDIYCIDMSKDGKYISTGSANGTIKVWDALNGQLLKSFTAHAGNVKSVRFTPYGNYLLSSAADGTVKIWNAADWSFAQTLTGHIGPVNGIDISADGKVIATIADDSSLIIRSWGTWQVLEKLTIPATGALKTVAFSPDTKKIAVGGITGYVALWNISGIPTSTREATPESFSFMPVFPNPATNSITVPEKSCVLLTDMSGRELWKTYSESGVVSLETLPSGFYFITIKNQHLITTTKLIKQ